ncbi:DUF4157 domain-containing protein [Burkholderia sp. Tr-849]|nr:DUF4157 domain-containing protein [Burkholderia sp. Tr-849]
MERPGAGQALAPATRAAMQARLGRDLGDVRVHDDPATSRAAAALGAQAFTLGKHVFFGSGRYRQDAGDALLTHELVHVAQQDGSRPGLEPTDNPAHEAQARRAETGVADAAGRFAVTTGARGIQRKEEDGSSPAGGGAALKNPPEKHPGFWSKVGHGIASAAGTVWEGIKTGASAVWRGLKAVGHGIAVAADAVWTGLQWVGRQIWSKVSGIFERVAEWVQRLPARLARLVLGLWEGVKSMKPWSLSWWESLGKVDTWLGFLKWLGANALYLIDLLGVGEAYETMMDFAKFNTRKLTGREIASASSVFGASINFERVRVDERAVIGPAFSGRAYTSFHTINDWSGTIDEATLIHELTHVWQYEQSGSIYMAQALHAQIELGATGAYNYNGVTGLMTAKAAGNHITSFNREQQAQIVEDYYRIKNPRLRQPGSGTLADLPLFAYFVKDASTISESQLAKG